MKNIAAVAVAAIGLTAGAVGLAQAGPGDPPAQATPTTTTAPADHPGPGPKGGRGPGAMGALGHAVHGDLIVRTKDGTFEKVVFDRGTLTASDADSLTLHRPDGVDVTVKVDDQTRYKGVENAAALQQDQPVAVVAKDGTAKAVMQRDPDAPRRPKGDGMRRPGRPGAAPTPPA
jgi:hypothetical protein